MDATVTDPTRIDITTDPTECRMKGVTHHGNMPFDVPYMSEVGYNLWQGGCKTGLILPDFIKHVVSLYPWERYTTHSGVMSELYVRMYDSESQGYGQVDEVARWVNERRQGDPVLVHCQAGLNRSSLIAARALHIFEGLSGDGCVSVLRGSRSRAVLCNPAFEAEVRSWT